MICVCLNLFILSCHCDKLQFIYGSCKISILVNGVFTRIHILLSLILSFEEYVFIRLPNAFLGLFEYGWSVIQASTGPVSVTTWHLGPLLCTTVLKLVSCLLELKMGQCRYVPTCFDYKTYWVVLYKFTFFCM